MPGAAWTPEPSFLSPGTLPPEELLESPRPLEAQPPKSMTAARPDIVKSANRFMWRELSAPLSRDKLWLFDGWGPRP